MELDPLYAEGHYVRGRALLELGRFDEAAQAFAVAIEEDVCPLRALAETNELVAEAAQRDEVPLVDFRGLRRIRSLGVPVCFDATHSVQLPGGQGTSSGGEREFVATLANAAAAVGVDALFFEVHDDPDRALCDGPNQIPLDEFPALLDSLLRHDAVAREG